MTDRPFALYAFEIDNYDENNIVALCDEEEYPIGHPLRNMLIFLDNETLEVVYSEFPYVSGRDDFYTPDIFSKYNKRTLFTHLMNDTIWEILPNGIKPMYYVDFMDRKPPIEVIEEVDMDRKFDIFSNREYASIIHHLNENKDFLFFWYHVGEKQRNFALFNKNTKEIANIQSFKNDFDGGLFPYPKGFYKSYSVSLFFPSELKVHLESSKEIPKPIPNELLEIARLADKGDDAYFNSC